MQPVSTYSFMQSQTNIMNDTSQFTQRLANELSTGRKALDLSDNPDRQQILDMTLVKNNREAYGKTCTLADTTVSQYTVSLNNLQSIANTALKSIEGMRTTYVGRVSSNVAGSTDTEINALNTFKAMGQTINQAMVETTISLNEKSASGDGYLYSGLRSPSGVPTYSLPPVRDINTLPYFLGDVAEAPLNTTLPAWPPLPAAPVAPPTGPGAVAVDPTLTAAGPNLPTYDADYLKAAPAPPLPTPLSQAWGVQKVTIDDKQTVNLNFSSTDPAFQNLINGMRAAKTAADQAGNYSTATRDQYVDLAFSYLNRAINGGLDPTTNTWTKGIRDLEQQNSLNDESIQKKATYHTNSLGVLNTRLDSLIGVDTTTVTVQLATANNQLQASYKATASLLGMSLMNYLH